jgi:hypothetical protein
MSAVICVFNPTFSTEALIAQACNPNYLGGRDQEDEAGPGQIVLDTLSQKKPFTKKGMAEWLKQ